MKHSMDDHLLGLVACELCEPVTAIQGVTWMLLAYDVDAVRESKGIISRKTVLLSSTMRDLVDLAQLQAQRGAGFVLESVDLRDLLQQVVSNCAIPEGHAAPLLRLPARRCRIVADRNQALHALGKTLMQAYAASAEKQTLCVSIAVACSGGGFFGARVLSVCKGQRRLAAAGPGARRERSRPLPREEHGLGLSVVQKIMEIHG